MDLRNVSLAQPAAVSLDRQRPVRVALDGSSAARAAAITAVTIAHALQLRVKGLYVVDESLVLNQVPDAFAAESGQSSEPASRQQRAAWLQAQGEETLTWLEMQCFEAGVPVDTDILFGGLPDLLLRDLDQASLVAVGRRGRQHAGNPQQLGYHFHDIARGSPVPVLVGGAQAGPPRRLLLVDDGRARLPTAVAWTRRLQQALDGPATVLIPDVAVVEDPLAPDYRYLEEAGLGDIQVVANRPPAAAIVESAAALSADLIIVGGYRHGALMRWLLGSTLDELLRRSPVPVLIV